MSPVKKQAATAKKAASKPAAAKKKASVKKKSVAQKSTAKKPAPRGGSAAGRTITPEQRWHMISEAAYYRAEKRGFIGGDPAGDWIDAEAEIDAMLKKCNTVVKEP